MIREAIDRILEFAKVEILEVNGQKYSTAKLQAVVPPTAEPLMVNSLHAVGHYVNRNPDGQSEKNLIIYVPNPFTVRVLSTIIKEAHMQRGCYMIANAISKPFRFGEYLDLETFMVSIQTLFVASVETEVLLKVLGNITDGKVTHYNDDGVSQQVTAKTGITRVDNVRVPSPLSLRPYRTFTEITQPESKFILRLKSVGADRPPHAALFEVERNKWQLEAIDNIVEYLNGLNMPPDILILH